ncbi:MAG: hypothetical protein FWG97_05555, partial [Deltaproteobacteria bacterium]|nr:hypothetical protein [Deltaproteobacteria bacterium]
MPVTFDSFYNKTIQLQNQDKTLTVNRDQVVARGGRNNPAANREAIAAFLKSLRAEYGDRIADMISQDRLFKDEGATPLTSRKVIDLTLEAEAERFRVKDNNLSVVKKFLSGNSEGRDLKAALERYAEKYKVSPENLEIIKNRVADTLLQKAKAGAFNPTLLSPEALYAGMEGNMRYAGKAAIHTLAVALGHELEAAPGSVEDKLRLADLGLKADDGHTYQRAAWLLNDMRSLQNDGRPLTQETVWKAVFNEALPHEIASGDKSFSAAMAERCLGEVKDLVWSMPPGAHNYRKPDNSLPIHLARISNAFRIMPWDKIKSLMADWGQKSVSLGEMPGFGKLFQNLGDLDNAKKALSCDNPRSGARPENLSRDAKWPPPAFTFNLPDGKTEKIQVGTETNFRFSDEADKQAYLAGNNNSLSEALIKHSQAVCGPGATEAQLAGVLGCLTQVTLTRTHIPSSVTGIEASTRGIVDVSLSRRPDGVVVANFSTPREIQGRTGSFSMELEVAPDGKVSVREFELLPPRLALKALARADEEARRLRIEDAERIAGPLMTQDELGKLAGRHLAALAPGAHISPKLLAPLREMILQRLSDEAGKSEGNLTREQVQTLFKAVTDGYFRKLNNDMIVLGKEARASLKEYNPDLTKEALDAKCDSLIRASLATVIRPWGPFVPFIVRDMAGPISASLGGLLTAGSGEEAAKIMGFVGDLREALYERTMGRKTEFSAYYTKEDFDEAFMVGLGMGLQELIDPKTPEAFEAFALSLARPGGPYRDLIHTLAQAPGFKGEEGARHPARLLASVLEGVCSPETLARLEPDSIRERDLSLPLQRKLLGPAQVVTRGAGLARPGLEALNETLLAALPDAKRYLTSKFRQLADLGVMSKRGASSGQDLKSGLGNRFVQDYNKDGLYVNGKYYHPGQTGAADIKKLFPDSYTAEKLANLANGSVQDDIRLAISTALEAQGNDDLAKTYLKLTGGSALRNTHIETLDVKKGLYRVTSQLCHPRDNQGQLWGGFTGVERCLCEVSLVVNLGAPGVPPPDAPPRPKPNVENVEVNFLVRGWEAVPGEPDDTPQDIRQVLAFESFQRAAEQPQNADKTLLVRDGRLIISGGENDPAANREAIAAFLGSLGDRYGNNIADMITNSGMLRPYQEAGRPLTGQLVQDLTRLAEAETSRRDEQTRSVSMVNQFLAHSWVGCLADLLGPRFANFPPENMGLLKARVAAFLHRGAQRGDFSGLTPEALSQGVKSGDPRYVGEAFITQAAALGLEGSIYPGRAEDKVRLADLGLRLEGPGLPFQAALSLLEEMRLLQPNGELTLETVRQVINKLFSSVTG